jgi:hypothetical protein
MPGKYKALYQYLDNRYANTVVLTFVQIEDLLGFALPDAARVDHAWWANNSPNDTHRLSRDRGRWPAGQPSRTCRPRPWCLNERKHDTCGDFLTRLA